MDRWVYSWDKHRHTGLDQQSLRAAVFANVTGSIREGNGLSDERDSLDYLGMIQGYQQICNQDKDIPR